MRVKTAEEIATLAERLVADVLVLAQSRGVSRDEATREIAKASLVCRTHGCPYHSDPSKMRAAANVVAQLGLDMAEMVDEWQDAQPRRSN